MSITMHQRGLYALCIVLLSILLVGCNSSPGGAVSYSPPFSPVTFSLNTKGEIIVTAQGDLPTPIGTFSISANITNTLQDPPTDTLDVIIRHKEGANIVDTVYQIKTSQQELDVTLNGTTHLTITKQRIFVDASNGQVKAIEVKSTVPTPTPTPSAVPGNVLLQTSLRNASVPEGSQIKTGSDGFHGMQGRIGYSSQVYQNVTISLTVELITYDPPGNLSVYGITFGEAAFCIRPNGTWIFTTAPGWSDSDFTSSPAVHQGLGASNTLKMRVQGAHFDLYVNGTKVGEQTLSQNDAAGSIGFFVSPYGAEAVFTDLLVVSN